MNRDALIAMKKDSGALLESLGATQAGITYAKSKMVKVMNLIHGTTDDSVEAHLKNEHDIWKLEELRLEGKQYKLLQEILKLWEKKHNSLREETHDGVMCILNIPVFIRACLLPPALRQRMSCVIFLKITPK